MWNNTGESPHSTRSLDWPRTSGILSLEHKPCTVFSQAVHFFRRSTAEPAEFSVSKYPGRSFPRHDPQVPLGRWQFSVFPEVLTGKGPITPKWGVSGRHYNTKVI